MSAAVALTTGVAPRNPGIIQHYHAHVYYDDSTRDRAARLRERVAAAFPEATLGRWHNELVGPHLRSMVPSSFSARIARIIAALAHA